MARIALFGKFEILGISDIMNNKNRRDTTLTCISLTAKTFFINAENFHKLFKSQCFDENIVFGE